MILENIIRWLVTFLLLLPKANLQMPLQLYPMPQMFAMPAPQPPSPPTYPPGAAPAPPLPAMAFQLAMPIPIPVAKPTTTERNVGVAVPIRLSFPIQVAIPAQPPPDFCLKRPRPNNCPVCPPCLCNPCTPAFFSYCSSCHLKCRCRNGNDTPEPLPHEAPIPVAGPAFPVAIPSPYMGPSSYLEPFHWTRKEESEENTDSSNSGSSEWSHRAKRSKKRQLSRRRSSIRRHNMDSIDEINDDELKPVLSYLSSDGAVKLEKALSDDDAKDLLDENTVYRGGYSPKEDLKTKQRFKIISDNGNVEKVTERTNHRHRHKQIFLNSGVGQHMLGDGKKKLFFNPPYDKKISNLSVSFQLV